MLRRSTLALGFSMILVLLVSCSGVHQMVGTLRDLQKVQLELAKATGGDEIRVNLMNGHFLNIGVLNSELKTLPSDERNAKALELARTAYSVYPTRSHLTSISVAFVTHRSYLGVFTYDDSSDTFRFDASQLTPEAQSPVESQP